MNVCFASIGLPMVPSPDQPQENLRAPREAANPERAAGDGDARLAHDILPLVYEQLKELARRRMTHERGDNTLQATALVHEAYLKLVAPNAGGGDVPWEGRGHFFAAAAEAMRRILIDAARHRQALRHGGGEKRVELDEQLPAHIGPRCDPEELVALDAALDRLAVEDQARAQLVKLHFYAGLSLEEAGAVLGISRATAHRHWTYARAWLRDAVRGPARRNS